jgi:hypothetical protein
MGDPPPRQLLVTDELKAQSERLRARRRDLTAAGPLTLSSAELDALRARLRQRDRTGDWRTA